MMHDDAVTTRHTYERNDNTVRLLHYIKESTLDVRMLQANEIAKVEAQRSACELGS